MSGRLIVIDGLDGSGKRTQAEFLYKFLQEHAGFVKKVSFPDYTQPSSALVKQYLSGEFGQADDVSAYAASSFYAVDRYASFHKFWKKDYEAGAMIIADRYVTSNYIHQMSKLPVSEWAAYQQWTEDFEYGKLGLPRPDLVLYLDMHPEVSQRLMLQRYEGREDKKDIHEANYGYMERCRRCALRLAEEQGWRVVPCSDENEAFLPEQIAQQISHLVKNTF